jgi:hypothetical protein
MLMIALPSKVFQLVAFQKFRQLGDIHRDPPRLIFGEQPGPSPGRVLPRNRRSELLAAVVAHDKAGVQFFDGPKRREAAGGHDQRPARAKARITGIVLSGHLRPSRKPELHPEAA